MPLFHPRVIEKHLRGADGIPHKSLEVLKAWAANLAAGNYDSETQNDAEFIQRILVDVLGYKGSSSGLSWTVAKNQPVGPGNVDVALGHFSTAKEPQILAPFELKGARLRDLDAVMPGRHKSPVQQAWEYAMDTKGARWVLVSNYKEIRLYAVGYGRKNYEKFDLAKMTEPAEFARFHLILAAQNFLSDRTLALLAESDAAEQDITKQLYADYKEVRARLIAEILSHDKKLGLTAVEISQTILDRVLFVAFAEDKGLLRPGTLKGASELQNPYSPQPIWENFKGLFRAINSGNPKLNIPGYNGGLFAQDSRIDALQLSDKVCARLAKIGDYDFDSDVSVNILGHIFEQSIADLEEIKHQFDPTAVLEEVGSKRRREGIFYTPAFVTRHIVEQALGRWLNDQKRIVGFDRLEPLTEKDYASIQHRAKGKRSNVVFNANVRKHVAVWEAYRTKLSGIRVVDPACGSGAFLNEVFDYLYREGQTINRELETLYGGQANLFRWDTHILANNIFGVDINRESVEITKLSLWLKTANRNEKLSYLDDNIRVGNSLISDRTVAGSSAFDWNAAFPMIMKAGQFDVVVGNPPYVDSEAMSRHWAKEREYLAAHYKQTRGNWDLYVAFFELGCNLLADDGYLSFISPDKWITKPFGLELRKRVLPGLVSILPVGRDVFESALVDSIITTIKNGQVAKLEVLSAESGEVSLEEKIAKTNLNDEAGFDQLLSSSYGLLQKFEASGTKRFGSVAICENACATSDTYELGKIIEDIDSQSDYDPDNQFKIANTGTLNRYTFRWGIKPMRYLKHDYTFPVVTKKAFGNRLGATYNRRASSPKIIIKGLTLLDGALDAKAAFVPGKSTLVVTNNSIDELKFLTGLINSRAVSFYVRTKYASASYNGGVNFTPDMINSIPIPNTINRAEIIKSVNTILESYDKIGKVSQVLFASIRSRADDGNLARLEDWYDMDAIRFLSELERLGIEPSVKERGQWVKLLDEKKAEVVKFKAALRAAEATMNSAIYRAYRLTGAEIKEIEAL